MIHQALWFLKIGGKWEIVAGFEWNLATDPDVSAMIAQAHATDRGVEYIVRQITAQHESITKRAEWNEPPRKLTVGIQPNNP